MRVTHDMNPLPEMDKTRSNCTMENSVFQLHLRDDDIAVITIDVREDKVNTLKAEFAEQITAIMLQAQRHPNLRGVVLISGKPDSFIAGADITMIAACHTAQQARDLAHQGQETLNSIAAFPVPVIAAIHGPCLGGGLELALACHSRICSLDDKTVLGLPEVQLGLLPGSGGTQRLPRLIGLPAALDMILTGKQIRARQALKMGLVDDAVPQAILLQCAIERIDLETRQASSPRLSWQQRVMLGPLVRKLIFKKARQSAYAKTQGNYPAAERILDVMLEGLEQGLASGYDAEARAFGELAMTPESAALRSLFFATTALKKDRGSTAESAPLHRIGVLGGGLMGGGIACVTATRAGLPVRIKDINPQGIANALKYSWQLLDKKVKRKHLSAAQCRRQMMLISGCQDYSGFAQTDLVIEAVFEDLSLKRQMVADIERYADPKTIFATNTSSLPIHQIAQEAQRPEQIIGLHYFSPVDQMPLVEVIPHANTSEKTIATTVSLAKRQGKTAIVVADRAGFYVNRILAPYINEAARCLLEGEPIDVIDAALVKTGFPVGPLTLLDEVGIDVGTKIIPILVSELGERFSAPQAFDAIINDNRKGRKNQRGFYRYPTESKKTKKQPKKVDGAIYTLLAVTPKAQQSAEHIAQRCIMLMLNEAARCLDEKVIRSARDGDIGAVFGIGFPPFLGGPFHYMDQVGIASIVQTLQNLAQQYGERFAPCESLLRMAEENRCFYP